MEIILQFIDVFLHIDQYIQAIANDYGPWLYLILFMIIFLETGVVVTPFLPGDSLLFAAGAIAAMGALDIKLLWLLLFVAAVLGDTLNYQIGHYFGIKSFKEDARIFKLKYLHATEDFYAKHGGKTIIIARFVPIIRTFAPFVAGASTMHYKRFVAFNVFGAFLWTMLMLAAGYLFGNIPWVKNNFSIIVLVIIFISCLPILIELGRNYKQKRKKRVA